MLREYVVCIKKKGREHNLLKLYLLDTSCEVLLAKHQGISKLNTICA